MANAARLEEVGGSPLQQEQWLRVWRLLGGEGGMLVEHADWGAWRGQRSEVALGQRSLVRKEEAEDDLSASVRSMARAPQHRVVPLGTALWRYGSSDWPLRRG